MSKSKEQQTKIERELNRLKDVPGRDPNVAARGRARFLAEASSMRPKPVMKLKTGASRQLAWRFALATLVVLGLLFVGSVGVVQASQDALPGQSLYPVKTLSEDVRLGLTADPQVEIDLLMRFSAVRVEEMNQLAALDENIPSATTARLESHVQRAMQLTAGLGDEEMGQALLRIRARLEEQDRNLVQSSGQAGGSLGQVHQMYQARLRWIEEGLGDQETFRNRMRFGQEDSFTSPVPSGTMTPPAGDGQSGGSTPGAPSGTPGGQHTPDKTPGPTGESGPPPWSGGPNLIGGSGGKNP